MKILFYNCKSLRFGSGPEVKLIELANNLVKQNVKVTIITTASLLGQKENITHLSLNKLLNSQINYVELPYITVPLSGSPLPLKLLGKYLQNVDLIYFYDGFIFQDLYLLLNKFLYKKKVIYGNHAPLYIGSKPHDLYIKYISLPLVKYFDAIHTMTQSGYDFWKKYTSKVFLLPYGIDIQNFKYQNISPNKIFTIITIGRLDYQKGIDLLPDIITKLNDRIGSKHYKYHICGSGPLESLINKLSASNTQINFHGYSQNLSEYLNSSDLYFSPTRYETLGSTLIEALACGLPVVSTDIQGPRQIINSPKLGKLSSKENLQVYVNNIIFYYKLWEKNKILYNSTKFDRSHNSTSRFGWPALIPKFISMYSSVGSQ